MHLNVTALGIALRDLEALCNHHATGKETYFMYFKKYIFPRFCVSQSLCIESHSVQLAVISTCTAIPCKQVLCLPKHAGIKMFQVHTGQAGTPFSKQEGVIDFSEIYGKPLNTRGGLQI